MARERVRMNMGQVNIPTGGVLCRCGEAPRFWYGAVDGLLKWSVSHRDGRSVTLGGLSAGSWFEEGALLLGTPHRADIIALRPSRVALMPIETFIWLHAHERSFSDFLLRQINERMQWFIGNLSASHLLGPDVNVAWALVGLFHPWLYPGSDPHLKVSQEEIANLSGISRPRCNAALRRLAGEGMIEIEYGGLRVLDLQALRQFVVASSGGIFSGSLTESR
uniref:Crp/Fnr family transcriptional regulator n=1 Tax=Castellaniella defragrans TaxID=75697 RepID=UPI00333E3C4B